MGGELRLEELKPILSGWGIKPLGVTVVRAAYRVAGGEGTVALKPSGSDGDHLRLVDEAFRYLETRGFHKTAPLLATRTGEPFLAWGGKFWTVSPWREGREPQYELAGDIARCADTLADFHLAGLGFHPGGTPIRNTLGKRPKKLLGRAGELRAFLDRATAGPTTTEFEAMFLELGPRVLHQAELAGENLGRTAYQERCEWGKKASPLAHGDASNRNFILGADGVAYLIDLDAIKLELPEIDLCRLVRRTMRRVAWNLDTAREILAVYSARAPLGTPEKAVMLALLQFPDKLWRLLKQYYRKETKGARLMHKLEREKENLPRWERFLRDFARLYGIPWFRWE